MTVHEALPGPLPAPAGHWPPVPPPTRAPAAGPPLTSSETRNLRSSAATFCLKFRCCKASGARSERAAAPQRRRAGAAQTAETRDLQHRSVKPRLCSDLEMGPQTGWWSGPNPGTEGDLRLFQKPLRVRPRPASVDRVVARVQGPICPSAAVGTGLSSRGRPCRSPGSPHKSQATGPGPEAHTDAVPAVPDALWSRQLAHSVFGNQPVASRPGQG